MNTPTRVAAFAGGLAAVFAAAVGVGTLTGPAGTVGAPDGVQEQPAATASPSPSASEAADGHGHGG